MMSMTAQTEKQNDYFGLCPVCHKWDGYANAGRSHRFYCREHKTSRLVGANLFSSWRYQTEEEQRRIWDEIGLDEYQDVDEPPIKYDDDLPIWKTAMTPINKLIALLPNPQQVVYQNRWMSFHWIDPLPAWTINWLYDLRDRVQHWRRANDQ
jgi:hypothetical protein